LVTSFAGLPLVMETYRALGLPQSVRKHLALLQRPGKYEEADYVESFLSLFAAGGDCLDDFHLLRRDEALQKLGLKVPSPEAGRFFLNAFHEEEALEGRVAHQTFIPEEEFKGSIPWTPLSKPLSQTTIALVTSAGISLKSDPPFDMEREKREAVWGDRSYRAIPRGTTEKDIDVNHLHINTNWIKQDINVILPLARMAEFEKEKIIGRLAPTAYSFYGFQWQNSDFLKEAIEPISKKMKLEGVEAVLLTPA
jgi:D-proline reductase (dithiol) PrdB